MTIFFSSVLQSPSIPSNYWLTLNGFWTCIPWATLHKLKKSMLLTYTQWLWTVQLYLQVLCWKTTEKSIICHMFCSTLRFNTVHEIFSLSLPCPLKQNLDYHHLHHCHHSPQHKEQHTHQCNFHYQLQICFLQIY